MSAALTPLLLTAAALLVISAVAKLRNPAPATGALEQLGVPAARLVTLAGTGLELLVAAAVVVSPTVGAPAGATLYVAFATLVVVQLHARSTRSCGCFGSADAPPSRGHVTVDLAFAAICAVSVVARPVPLAVLARPGGVIVWFAAGAAAWAVALALELVPQTLPTYRRPSE